MNWHRPFAPRWKTFSWMTWYVPFSALLLNGLPAVAPPYMQ